MARPGAPLLTLLRARAAPSQFPPLPLTAREYWHSELQCSAASWRGQIGGRLASAIGSPVVAADPGYFNGRQVAATGQTASTSYLWDSSPGGASDLYAAGSFPWVMLIARLRSTIASNRSMATVGRIGTQVHIGLIQSGSSFFQGTANNSTSIVGSRPFDTTPHTFRSWTDGSLFNHRVDSLSSTSAPFSASVPASAHGVWIGDSLGGSGNGAAVNTAFYLVCSGEPSNDEQIALMQWAQVYWGVP